MTDEMLLKLGFDEFSPSAFVPSGVEKCFQKCYSDSVGKKYFITIYKWKAFIESQRDVTDDDLYEYNTNLYKKDGHETVSLLFHNSWMLEDVEHYIEALWDTGLFDYYEEFEKVTTNV